MSFCCVLCDRSFGSDESLQQHKRNSLAHTFDCITTYRQRTFRISVCSELRMFNSQPRAHHIVQQFSVLKGSWQECRSWYWLHYQWQRGRRCFWSEFVFVVRNKEVQFKRGVLLSRTRLRFRCPSRFNLFCYTSHWRSKWEKLSELDLNSNSVGSNPALLHVLFWFKSEE